MNVKQINSFFQASKTLEKTGTTFLSNVKDLDVDVTHLFQDGVQESPTSALDQVKQQSEKVEAEELYFTVSHFDLVQEWDYVNVKAY